MWRVAWFFSSRLGQMASIGVLLGTGLVASAESTVQPTGAVRTLQPLVEKARGGQCVDDPAVMRRNHMDMLKHQRGDTLRGGIRTGKYSLKDCIACHASPTNDSVSASSGNFCQNCHAYAAVRIDCFECHANKPVVKP